MDIQRDLAGKLLESLAHAEISNALDIPVEALLVHPIPNLGQCGSKGSMRYSYITVVTRWSCSTEAHGADAAVS